MIFNRIKFNTIKAKIILVLCIFFIGFVSSAILIFSIQRGIAQNIQKDRFISEFKIGVYEYKNLLYDETDDLNNNNKERIREQRRIKSEMLSILINQIPNMGKKYEDLLKNIKNTLAIVNQSWQEMNEPDKSELDAFLFKTTEINLQKAISTIQTIHEMVFSDFKYFIILNNACLTFIGVLFFITIIILGTILVRTIAVPLVKLEQWSKNVSDGQLDLPNPVVSKDELGMVSKSIYSMVQSIKSQMLTIDYAQERLSSINRIVQGISVSNFEKNCQITSQKDVFDTLSSGINAMMRDLKEYIFQLDNQKKEILWAYQNLERIIDTMPFAIMIIDANKCIRKINNAARSIIGTSPETVVGKNCYNYLCFANMGSCPINDREIRIENQEQLVQTHDGRIIPVLKTVLWTRYLNEDMLLEVFVDITKIKEYQQKLQSSNQELEQFAYIASHDLKEPLRMITSFLNLLVDEYQNSLDDQAKAYINFAVNGSKRMTQLINDLLLFSRVQTHELKLSSIDMNACLDEVKNILKIVIEEKNATIQIEDIPTVLADHSQVIQLFQNLIENGIKYNKSDHPEIKIYKQQITEKDVIIAVMDNGIGIAKEYWEQIFEVFRRLHTSEIYSGTGIGLAICKKIAEKLEGSIWLESEEGTGTTFFIKLKRA
ncbi:MAG: hypothetical protein A2Y40_10280 [Candidatus Margulisbacteria bacterium GWF2_35_9]|nr:MAG: hypothetical protein A2Y40_10280 [Candidatus Margulisbacteria bacterium GWF2_35_9]